MCILNITLFFLILKSWKEANKSQISWECYLTLKSGYVVAENLTKKEKITVDLISLEARL